MLRLKLMPIIIVQPETTDTSTSFSEYGVKIFNNDHNSFEQVITILVLATECSVEEARIEAFDAHTYGSCVVYWSNKQECEKVAAIISQIGIKTEIVFDPKEG